jgi:AmmeMemoRadiSam system protein A
MDQAGGGALLRLAREAIEAAFDDRRVVVPADPWLQAPGAAFVTLRRRLDDALRGCIGSIEARSSLGDALVTAAVGAAFRDPRFRPLARAELSAIRLDISVLSPLARVPVADETDARARLERTRPGVVLSWNGRQGVLLPKVWNTIHDAGEFLGHLKAKAGLPAAFWSTAIVLEVFTRDEFAEPDDWAPREEAS